MVSFQFLDGDGTSAGCKSWSHFIYFELLKIKICDLTAVFLHFVWSSLFILKICNSSNWNQSSFTGVNWVNNLILLLPRSWIQHKTIKNILTLWLVTVIRPFTWYKVSIYMIQSNFVCYFTCPLLGLLLQNLIHNRCLHALKKIINTN